jgi:DHA2 family multidrug resistance protein
VRTTAGAFAVSITTTAWEDGGDKARVQILNQGGGFEGAVASLQTMGLSAAQAARQFEGLVQSQAVMVATDRLFLIIAGVLFLAGCTVWIAPKPKSGARAAPGGH